jgi:putative heme iron utilization protein
MLYNPLDAESREAAARLLASCHGVAIASADEDGRPLASHAPCLLTAEGLHVFVSRLARHSRNIARGPVAVLLMREDAQPRAPFARERLGLDCHASAVSAGAEREILLDAMQERFGAVMQTLRALPDFTLYRLQPQAGQYVQGFGRAYALSADELGGLLRAAAGALPEAQD